MTDKKKLTKGENDYVRSLSNGTRRAVELISRGRCTIECNEKGVRLVGKQDDLAAVKAFCEYGSGKKPKEKMTALLDRFNWKYIEDGDSLGGEGIVAFMLFNWLMSDGNDEVSELVREEILPRLSLAQV